MVVPMVVDVNAFLLGKCLWHVGTKDTGLCKDVLIQIYYNVTKGWVVSEPPSKPSVIGRTVYAVRD